MKKIVVIVILFSPLSIVAQSDLGYFGKHYAAHSTSKLSQGLMHHKNYEEDLRKQRLSNR